MTSPLPPANEDPAIKKGYEVRDAYTAGVQDIRADLRLSDLAKAEHMLAIWTVATEELAAARKDFEGRRAARVAALEAVVPVGPNLPSGLSPSDAAVLQSAFRNALAEAREADRPGRMSMLADAIRFQDEVTVRAVLTAASDEGMTDVIDRWASAHPELQDKLAELVAIRDGAVTAGMFARQAFGPIPKPEEVNNLPNLQQQAKDDAGFEARGLYRRPAGATGPEHLTAARARGYFDDTAGARLVANIFAAHPVEANPLNPVTD